MPALSDLANSRFGTVTAEAWRWWSTELGDMVPQRLRRAGHRPAADIRLGRDEVIVERRTGEAGERLVDARPIEALDEEGWADLGALIEGRETRLLLSLPNCHSLTISLPAAARGRLPAAVALQLPQIAPLEPDYLSWACRLVDSEAGTLRVRVAIARRTRIAELQSLFAENGLSPPAIFAETPDGPVRLAEGWATGIDAEARGRRLTLAVAASFLATIPFFTYLAASAIAATNEADAAALRKTVAPKIAADRRARSEEAMRRALRPLAARPTVSAALEDIARQLPETISLKAAESAAGGDLVVTLDSDAAQPVTDEQGNPIVAGAEILDQQQSEDGRLLTKIRMARR